MKGELEFTAMEVIDIVASNIKTVADSKRCCSCGAVISSLLPGAVCCDTPRLYTFNELVERERMLTSKLISALCSLRKKLDKKEDIEKAIEDASPFIQTKLF